MENSWIIFDVMGVIFEEGDDTNELLVPFIRSRRPALEIEYIQTLYHQASLGQLSAPEFWRLVGLGEEYPRIEQTYLDTCLKVDAQFLELAAKLSRKYSLAILSNDVTEWSQYLRRRHGLDQLFREVVISGDVGCRKPSPEIYQILLARLAVPARQCIFIDDRLTNLLAAMELGMTPIWFQRKPEIENPAITYSIWNFSQLPDLVEKIFSA